MQDLNPLHCLSPHQRKWGKPTVTHGKKQGKFVLEAEGKEVFPLGVHYGFLVWGVPPHSIRISNQNVVLFGNKLNYVKNAPS